MKSCIFKITLSLLFILAFWVNCFTQMQYQVTYGNTKDDVANSIIQTTDGGYVFTGSCTGNLTYMYVVKTDATLTIQWSKAINSGYSPTIGSSIIQDVDGGYVIAGSNWYSGSTAPSVYIVKLDNTGTIAWARDVDIGWQNAGYSIVQLPDKSYMVSGSTYSTSGGGVKTLLIKLKSDGTYASKYNYGALINMQDVARYMVLETDGGYVCAGLTNSYGQGGGFDLYLQKVKSDGSGLAWSATIGKVTTYEVANCITKSGDGGYVVAGSTAGYGKGLYDVYIVKYNNAGTYQWDLTVGGTNNDAGNAITLCNDGGFAVAGYTKSFGDTKGDMYLVKINASGSLLWTLTYGGTNDDAANSVIENTDHNLVIAGYCKSFSGTSANSDAIVFTSYLDGNICGASHRGTGGTALSGGAKTAGGGSLDTWAYAVGNSLMGAVVAFGTNTSVICSNWALPVDLLSFTGQYTWSKATLNWSTATELNNDYFSIERAGPSSSTPGSSLEYLPIGKVYGAGNSSYTRNYFFVDTNLSLLPSSATLYYRLRQTDYNGDYNYYGPVAITLMPSDEIVINTNAANEQIFISFPESCYEKNCIVTIYDMSGKVCFSSPFIPGGSKQSMWINISPWSAGVYLITAQSAGGSTSHKKFVKQ